MNNLLLKLRKYFTPTAHLRKKSLFASFLAAALLLLILPSIGLNWRLHYFLPPLIICLYQKPLQQCLWLSIIFGLVVDVVSGMDILGIYPLAYFAAILCIHHYKQFFFADSWFTLPVLTAIGSCVVSLGLIISLYLLNKNIQLSPMLLLLDCFLMALYDSLYAFTIFVLPAILCNYRRHDEYFA